MKTIIILSLLIFAGIPGEVYAYDGKPDSKGGRFYASILGKFTVPEPSDIDGELYPFSELSNSKLSLNSGLNASVALGWKFRNGWRGEIEYSIMSHDSGRIESSLPGSEHFTIEGASETDQSGSEEVMRDFCGGELGPATGHTATCGGRLQGGEIEKHQDDRVSFDTSGILPNRKFELIMINAVRDFDNASWGVTPYLGFGVGVGREEEAEGREFAYQFLAGMSLDVLDPFELILGYRFVGMTKLDYKYKESNYSTSATFHNLEFGVRYLF